ncbi:DUF3304 domain-containing protein [Burkholderia gladioli]|uniref:DUF3304 domain-containing protein n=1 Tax=Burkholderia gladioli TaxID=28095 RepID=UPI001FC82AA3|nr:DUF3304 domain-containing protein [Burkholderia gladioli]
MNGIADPHSELLKRIRNSRHESNDNHMTPNTKHVWIAIVTVMIMTASACSRSATDGKSESLGPRSDSQWNDPNVDIVTAGSYNYTDYDIYGVYLLPPDKNSLDYAASADGARATPQSETAWSGGPGSRASLAWDLRWKTPKTIKIWWERVVDKRLMDASAKNYDPYTQQQTQPGMAWCEGEITITRPPIKDKNSGLLLHFFPDGRVEGDMDLFVGTIPTKVDIAKRNDQPKLTDRPCLKEISNPFYGRKKPVQWN